MIAGDFIFFSVDLGRDEQIDFFSDGEKGRNRPIGEPLSPGGSFLRADGFSSKFCMSVFHVDGPRAFVFCMAQRACLEMC